MQMHSKKPSSERMVPAISAILRFPSMLHICEQDWVCGSSSLNIGSGIRFTFALCAFERIKRKKEEKYDKPCFQISRKKFEK